MSEMKINNISDYFKKDDKDKNNSSNEISISYLHQKNNLKNKRAVNKMNKKLKINSISELEFLYNDSQIKTTFSNEPVKSKKKNLTNLSTNNANSTTDILIYEKNNRFPRQNKNKSSFNNFLKKVNQHEEKRKNKINNLKSQIITKENSQILSLPKMCKRSKYLANSKSRRPLYMKKPLNEEKSLEKDFLGFYKEIMSFTFNEKISSDERRKIQEKINNFYEDNITWEKNRDDKLKNIRNEKLENDKMNKFSFKPIINKNSIRLVKKVEKINSIYSNQITHLNNHEYEQELLDQLKIKLKPILSECIDNNKKIPYMSKRSKYLTRNSANNNKTKKINRNKSYQILTNTNISKDTKKIKYTPKKEKKKGNFDEINEQRNYDINRSNYENFLLNKFEEMDNLKSKRKKELYKLNVRQGTSWNPDCLNKIIPKKKYDFIIKDFL